MRSARTNRKAWTAPTYGRAPVNYGQKLRARRAARDPAPPLLIEPAHPLSPADEPQAPEPQTTAEQPRQPHASAKLRPAKTAAPAGMNTAQSPPRDRRVPLVEMNGLLVKTINVLADSPMGRMEIRRAGGASASTQANWLGHRVKSPRLDTFEGTLAAVGCKVVIIGPDGDPI